MVFIFDDIYLMALLCLFKSVKSSLEFKHNWISLWGNVGAPRGFGDLGRRAIYFQGAGEHC